MVCRKILDLKKEVDFLKGFVDRHVKSRSLKQREAAEREELLTRRAEVMDILHRGVSLYTGCVYSSPACLESFSSSWATTSAVMMDPLPPHRPPSPPLTR